MPIKHFIEGTQPQSGSVSFGRLRLGNFDGKGWGIQATRRSIGG
jgi:hypothetical protein